MEQPGSRTEITSVISARFSPSFSSPDTSCPSLSHLITGLRPAAAAEQVREEEEEERGAGLVVITREEEGEGGRTLAKVAVIVRRMMIGNIIRLARSRPTREDL